MKIQRVVLREGVGYPKPTMTVLGPDDLAVLAADGWVEFWQGGQLRRTPPSNVREIIFEQPPPEPVPEPPPQEVEPRRRRR